MKNLLQDIFEELDISIGNPDDLLRAIAFRNNLLMPETARKVLGVLTLEDSDSLPNPEKTTGDVTIDKLLFMLGPAMKGEEPGCADFILLVGHPIYNALCDLVEKSFAYAQLTNEEFRQAQTQLALDTGNPFRETTYRMALQLLSPIPLFPRLPVPELTEKATPPDGHPLHPAL